MLFNLGGILCTTVSASKNWAMPAVSNKSDPITSINRVAHLAAVPSREKLYLPKRQCAPAFCVRIYTHIFVKSVFNSY